MFLTTFAFLIGVAIFHYGRQKKSYVVYLGLAIFGGLLTSLVAGLLDYYQVIDLRSIRALDWVVNPYNTQVRLQSFFGHSGWYAEYLTLTAPFAIMLLTLPIRFRWRVILIVSFLLLGEYALLLTLQRGGWISYPLTLFAIWAAVYVTYKIEKGESNVLAALRSSFIKIMITLPATVIITLSLIYFVITTGIIQSDRALDMGTYFGRLRDIKRTEDRTGFIKAGFSIGALHPIFGAGSESFCYQYEQEVIPKKGQLYKKFRLLLHGTAHNVYAQIFAGKGIVGLFLLILSLGYLIYPSAKLVVNKDFTDHKQRIVVLCGASFAVAFFIYGLVQEIFYVQSLQLLYFSVLAIVGVVINQHFQLTEKTIKKGFLLLLALFVLHLAWEYLPARRQETEKTYGCYKIEKTKTGPKTQWCGPKAYQEFPVIWRKGAPYVSVKIQTHFFKEGQENATFNFIASNNVELFSATLSPNTGYKYLIPLPSDLAPDKSTKKVMLNIKANSYFIPHKVFKEGDDYRLLAFQLLR